MQKRGQVTVFLIVGILILAAFAGILYLNTYLHQQALTKEEEQFPITSKIKPQVSSFVESCLQKVALPGIYLLGIQGGILYFDDLSNDPTKVLITDNAVINYAYLDGVNQLSSSLLEEQLSKYLEAELPTCLNNFSLFSEQAIKVSETKPMTAKVLILAESVNLELKYPLDIVAGEEVVHVDTFWTNIPLRLGRTLDEAQKLIEKEHQNPAALTLSPMTSLSPVTSLDYFLSVFPFSKEVTIYSLSDSGSVIDGAQFTLMFAVKESNYNSPPRLDYIPDFGVNLGAPFVYTLTAKDAEDDALEYFSDSALVPVNKEGQINTVLPAGNYKVEFKVKDSKGLEDMQKVKIAVE